MNYWYCWKILLKTSPKARKIRELSFVSGSDLTTESAVRRARVGLFYQTHDERFMNAFVIMYKRLGPFETIQDATKEKEISLIKDYKSDTVSDGFSYEF